MLPAAAAGLRTTGYPIVAAAARAWSGVSARTLAAEGTLKAANAARLAALSRQVWAVAVEFPDVANRQARWAAVCWANSSQVRTPLMWWSAARRSAAARLASGSLVSATSCPWM